MPAKCRIATYNLRFGGRADNLIHWQKVLDEIEPDIFLVQETRSPEHYFSEAIAHSIIQQTHWQPVTDRYWGSAVYSKRGDVIPLACIAPEFTGWVTGVEIRNFGWPLPPQQSLHVYSVHAPSVGSSYVKQVNLILDGIKAQAPVDALVIIGGDFNMTLGIRHPLETLQQSQPKTMSRFRRELGLINCWQAANPNRNLPQTLRWSNDKVSPFHCDGIFVPATFYRWLEKTEVRAGNDWNSLSDHNPVTATLEDLRRIR